MYNTKTRPLIKSVSVLTAFIFLFELIYPTAAFALTAGPSAPEFSSFEPVSTTDMVNVFNGDYVYNLPVINIPGTEGGGYALSLSYHSGANVEEEASWVGYGWTLNPGAINRGTKGFPDDYNGANVTSYSKSRPVWTSSFTVDLGIEAFSFDATLGASGTVRYNNYQGFSKTLGFDLGVKGYGSLGMSIDGNDVTFHPTISPSKLIDKVRSKVQKARSKKVMKKMKNKSKKQKENHAKLKRFSQKFLNPLLYDSFKKKQSYNIAPRPASLSASFEPEFYEKSFNLTKTLQFSPTQLEIGAEAGFTGGFNIKYTRAKDFAAAYGYMHSRANSSGNMLSDYYYDNDSKYKKRDQFIGIPFNNADQFVLTGEGLSGGFRAYNKPTGHFYTNEMNSSSDIVQANFTEFGIGVNLDIGGDFGVGYTKTKIKTWEKEGSAGSYKFNSSGNNEPYFRFNGDLGGEVVYAPNDQLVTAKVEKPSSNLGLPGVKQYEPNTNDFHTYRNNWTSGDPDPASSSFIQYHTLGSMGTLSSRFNKNSNTSSVDDHVSASTGLYAESIGEFSIHNSSGVNYIYGLPVYNKDVREVSVNIDAGGSAVYNNYITEKSLDDNLGATVMKGHKVFQGIKKDVPYSSDFLLTQILQPNYVDVGDDGPNDGDYGGWTRFEYKQAYGISHATGDWYTWRFPYSGLYYDQGQLSNKFDDIGAYKKGKKEVYYLKAIETNSHVAFFITNKTDNATFANYFVDAPFMDLLEGSNNDRFDGYGASESSTADDANKSVNSCADCKQLEYLERIVLYSKERPEKPVKIVNFEYDNSLVQGVSNNIYSNTGANYENSGKLTLKKVWFEYEGVYSAQISPYLFNYNYPEYNDPEITAKYPEIASYASNFVGAENPGYDPNALDMWGNHQYDGANRKARLNRWLYQGVIPSTDRFDPAAWQLKQIVLPSGGEIHIQYEQDDYSSVQDRNPMAMVKLLNKSYDGESTLGEYFLDLSDLGYTLDNPDFSSASNPEQALDIAISDLNAYINSQFVGQDDKRMYFRFLYALKGNFIPELDGNCKVDYITGYAPVHESVIIPISNAPDEIRIKLGTSGKKDSPRNVCLDYIRAFLGGRLKNNGCSTQMDDNDDWFFNQAENSNGEYVDPASIGSMATKVETIIETLTGVFKDVAPTLNNIGKINPQLSYLKIPVLRNKRGGGIRVKRLLMYDKGIEKGSAMIYGKEYLYEDENGISSGVATNEPSVGREENALVEFWPRDKQSWVDRAVAGPDKKEHEGPLGESILPSPSVGYSRVIEKNIHSGTTGNGFTKHEYFTVKDYPYDKMLNSQAGRSADLTNLSSNMEKDYMLLPLGLLNFKKNRIWMAQGFKFVQHDFHGKPKAVYTYGGDLEYNDPAEEYYLSSAKVYDYYEPGEKVTTLNYDKNLGKYVTNQKALGKELDVTMGMRSVRETVCDFSLELDLSIGLSWFPPIFISGMLFFDYQDSELNTHATTKVINYPVLTKRVSSFQDGAWGELVNLAFSETTGDPILTRITDDYNNLFLSGSATPHHGYYYNMTLPASWYYPEMGRMSDELNNLNQLSASAGNILSYGADGSPIGTGATPSDPDLWFSDPKNVVEAKIMSYSNDWYDLTGLASGTVYEVRNDVINSTSSSALSELNKFYYPHQNFVYEEDAVKANDGSNRIYNSGMYSSFKLPNPVSSPKDALDFSVAPKWKLINEIIAYNASGYPVSERNYRGTVSSVKYGYDKKYPVILGKNAEYGGLYFHDYEFAGDYSNYSYGIVDYLAHTGNFCAEYTTNMIVIDDITITPELHDQGALIQFWLRNDAFPDMLLNGGTNNDEFGVQIGSVNGITKIKSIVGNWMLMEGTVDVSGLTLYNKYDLKFTYNASQEWILIDDVKLQPTLCGSRSMVYDFETGRLLAEFDNQHYALIYQYNMEGNLIRKMHESDRGVKTIQETQYNIPTVQRP